MDPTNGYIYYTGLFWIPSWFPSYIGVITPDGDTTDIPMDDAADMVDLVLHPEMGLVLTHLWQMKCTFLINWASQFQI